MPRLALEWNAEEIRCLRICGHRAMSIEAFADEIGVNMGTVSRWSFRSRNRQVPSPLGRFALITAANNVKWRGRESCIGACEVDLDAV